MTEIVKSSYCSGGDCILAERDEHEQLWLRSSVDPAAEFRVTREELAAFLAGAKAGEFDHLAEEAP